jgi:hypothetical protein
LAGIHQAVCYGHHCGLLFQASVQFLIKSYLPAFDYVGGTGLSLLGGLAENSLPWVGVAGLVLLC